MNISTHQEYRNLSDSLLKSDESDGRFAIWSDRTEDGVAEMEVECRWSDRTALIQYEQFDGLGYCHIIPTGVLRESRRNEAAWWTAKLHEVAL